ncbi:MAG: L,D-transpeptidase [Chloroflexi bacterium]|nr:L,D-transpeptidase [Chloroflexota bacterium]
MKLNGLSRRDFLKLSGLGLAGLFAPSLPLDFLFDDPYDAQQGRVTSRLAWSYESPSYTAPRVKMFWRDLVMPIVNATTGEDETAHNRVWYDTGTDGYVYSGNIQPVRTILNAPRLDIPETGLLSEVSVPYSDAHEFPNADSKVGYRVYYETVHWIKSIVVGETDGKPWYQIWDDKWDKLYYVPAEHLRILSDEELAPLSPEIPNEQKRIEVRLNDQLVIAYENDSPVFVTRAATGAIYRVGTYTTPTGHFMTFHKRPTRHMAAGDLTASGYDLPGVPWVLYITDGGISFHGTYWHNDFGRPRSHGCINLTVQAAKWLYLWTTPVVNPGDQFAFKSLDSTKVEIVV